MTTQQTLSNSELQAIIEKAFDARNEIDFQNPAEELSTAVTETLGLLDSGKLRVAEKIDGEWVVHQWAKKAVLLSFRLNPNEPMAGAYTQYFDKVPSKFADWSQEQFVESGVRVVPPAVARAGSFIGKNVVLMPSYTNIGAYVDEGTMVDTWATV
ncbi:MAG TPA: 2,3,4,5-tetrahydropyridine-2,6-dicarboxylate N-succinyltransferase, partial [Gammaproteobacteria bacterium]|nr:2,3,4,5-tetrahydropyridine-2,6-dicarboxylate N-succinyltransferase [Gammaproteobacteria bacterium]